MYYCISEGGILLCAKRSLLTGVLAESLHRSCRNVCSRTSRTPLDNPMCDPAALAGSGVRDSFGNTGLGECWSASRTFQFEYQSVQCG